MNQLAPLPAAFSVPALVATAGDKANKRFLEFFAAIIRNVRTRRAYSRASVDFMECGHQHDLESLIDIEPLHVATWIEMQVQAGCAAPSVKQRLAVLRRLFDWLVVGQIVPANPAHSRARPAAHREGRQDPCARSSGGARLARQNLYVDAGRLARSGVDRDHGLFVRASGHGARHEDRGCLHTEPPASGFGNERRGDPLPQLDRAPVKKSGRHFDRSLLVGSINQLRWP
jgi:hypothetical protein